VGLAVAISENERTVEMALATPLDSRSRSLSYGGPPRSLARWATNLALNWLRTSVDEKR
jgi:hypothetical protein